MKLIYQLSLICFLIFSALAELRAQTGEVRGFIYDAKTGEPVIFSPVFLKGTRFGVNTDVNGFFSISKIPPGTYQLLAVNLLYDTVREKIDIESGRIINRKYFLKENILSKKQVSLIA